MCGVHLPQLSHPCDSVNDPLLSAVQFPEFSAPAVQDSSLGFYQRPVHQATLVNVSDLLDSCANRYSYSCAMDAAIDLAVLAVVVGAAAVVVVVVDAAAAVVVAVVAAVVDDA